MNEKNFEKINVKIEISIRYSIIFCKFSPKKSRDVRFGRDG